MKNLNSLEIFFFPRSTTVIEVYDGLMRIIREMAKMYDIKFVSNFHGVDEEKLERLIDALKKNKKIAYATVNFKDFTMRKKYETLYFERYEID